MSADQKAVIAAEDEISAEALRKAEEYVQQEEGAGNRLTGWVAIAVTAIAVAMTVFHLYAAYEIVPTQPLRYTHLAFVLVLTFLLFPLSARFRNRIEWFDVLAGLLAIGIMAYALMGGDDFTDRAAVPNQWDVVLGVALIVLVLEASRRTAGPIMPVVSILFLAYALFGEYLPPPWTHRSYDVARLVGHMFITLEGIFGVALDVSATLIVMFTIYGAILLHSGAGKFFIDFSLAVMGNKPSSAGRSVVASSFLLGGPSGSGVATTVMIGTVAWPMLKKAGFKANAAGGLLAAGGLGAIISPPVLGAAAFLIAEFLKISYLDVIWMAVIPTCLYYLSLLFMVELDAFRFGAREVVFKTEMPLGQMVRRYGFHFVSLIAVIVFMIVGYSPMLSVFLSTLLAFVMSGLAPETALGPRRVLIPLLAIGIVAIAGALIPGLSGIAVIKVFESYFPLLVLIAMVVTAVVGLFPVGQRVMPESKKLTAAFSEGAIGVLGAATTCASAGIIVGVVTLTGLGLKFSSIVIDMAGGSLLLTAIYTGLVVWIIGLAVPVTASYIICAVIAAPALTKLGVPDFAAHMFIFYYAVLSEVSPPTALSPFAAAAITGGDPYKTTLQAWKYTLPAFLVPFVFVLDPQGLGLLMKIPKGGSVTDIFWITFVTAAGLAALAAAAQGWAIRRTTRIEQFLFVLSGLLLVFPSLLEALAELLTGRDIPYPAPFGLILGVSLLLWQWKRPLPAQAQAAG
ncbi:TRAP transporter fused permease subunit [Pseudolabrys sp. FHR47]|uniref:TRAP transporter permease n=1 Tax=Pseudolabrys sp. FHR47 TaxID=2562284 RepID=UPI0010BEB8AC|nr:TRAP transporter fused permease subunit [Pseudolabrys sp. FHR47]